MKSRAFAVTLAMASAAIPLGAVAEVQRYDCEFSGFGRTAEQSFVPKLATFYVDTETETAKAAMAFHGEIRQEPWPLNVKGIGRKNLVFSWLFKNLETTGTSDLSLNYRVSVNTATHKASLRAVPRGWDGTIGGRGQCRRR